MPNLDLLKANITSAEATGRKAGEMFNSAQDKAFDHIAKGLQQISLVAGGTISLSITFIGYVIGKHSLASALTTMIFCKIPIIWIMYISWASLIVAVILGLLYQVLHAWEHYALVGDYWAQCGVKVWDAHIVHKNAGGTSIKAEDGSEVSLDHMESTKKEWTKTVGTFGTYKNAYAFLSRWSRRITIVAFIFGLLCLLVFAIILVNQIIFI